MTAILPSASPKILWDCASTAHIVDNVDLLDDFIQSVPPTKVRWGTEGNMMLSHGTGTLQTKNYLPEGKVAFIVFNNVKFVPGFGINVLSVKYVASRAVGGGVLFQEGAHYFDSYRRLVGWSPELKEHTDLYPLICEVMSGKGSDRTLYTSEESVVSDARRREILTLHDRLAHVGATSVGRVHTLLTQAELAVIRTCPQCLAAKMVRRSYPSVPAAF